MTEGQQKISKLANQRKEHAKWVWFFSVFDGGTKLAEDREDEFINMVYRIGFLKDDRTEVYVNLRAK